MVVLNTLLGKKEEAAKLKQKLETVNKAHPALVDWKEKKEEFERARAKYTPKFEA